MSNNKVAFGSSGRSAVLRERATIKKERESNNKEREINDKERGREQQ